MLKSTKLAWITAWVVVDKRPLKNQNWVYLSYLYLWLIKYFTKRSRKYPRLSNKFSSLSKCFDDDADDVVNIFVIFCRSRQRKKIHLLFRCTFAICISNQEFYEDIFSAVKNRNWSFSWLLISIFFQDLFRIPHKSSDLAQMNSRRGKQIPWNIQKMFIKIKKSPEFS